MVYCDVNNSGMITHSWKVCHWPIKTYDSKLWTTKTEKYCKINKRSPKRTRCIHTCTVLLIILAKKGYIRYFYLLRLCRNVFVFCFFAIIMSKQTKAREMPQEMTLKTVCVLERGQMQVYVNNIRWAEEPTGSNEVKEHVHSAKKPSLFWK